MAEKKPEDEAAPVAVKKRKVLSPKEKAIVHRGALVSPGEELPEDFCSAEVLKELKAKGRVHEIEIEA